MSHAAFLPLLAILDREESQQEVLLQILDDAHAAARTRSLDGIEQALQQFEAHALRAKAFAKERDDAVARLASRLRCGPTLRALAGAPGAPSEELLKRRERLADLSNRSDEKSRYIVRLVRELGDIYESAINAIVQDRRMNAAAHAGAGTAGSFMNIEA
jgi:hypothetical protein